MIKIFIIVTKTEREVLHTKTHTNKIYNVLIKKKQKCKRKGDINRQYFKHTFSMLRGSDAHLQTFLMINNPYYLE